MTKKYRDGLFRSYFSDKRRLLRFCNLLTGEDATDPDEIIINTLDGVFFDSFKNDISCLFRKKLLVIVEHQSTINENMPLRMLFYAAELLRQYTDERRNKLYTENMIRLPAPQFIVFYNGRKKEVAQREMRLSDAFMEPTTLALDVKLYNLNAGFNDDFIARDESLNHYCIFVNLVEKLLAEGMDYEHALMTAINYCIAHSIMKEYLLLHKKEVASMLALEYDEAVARQAWIDHGVEIGTERGIEIGTEREKNSTVKNLLTTNLPLKEIARVVGWTAKT